MTEIATFAAGCFWGIEAAFQQLTGVVTTSVGYTGSKYENPTYADVCSGSTGHAEAVQVEFDPQQIAYEDLLNIFWRIHDPTTPNRQGPDVGTQYRSVIFFHTPQQESAAKASKDAMDASGKFGSPIVTEIVPTSTFYSAEEYHQKYLEKRGMLKCH